MNTRRYMMLLLSLAMTIGAWAQNRLSVPEVQGTAGKVVTVPISMSNQQDIVGVQFDIQLPFSRSASNEPTLNTSRNPNGHTVGIRALGNYKYTVVVASMANKSLSGNGGVLVNLPMNVPSDTQPETDYPITLSNVVLTDRQGNNLVTGATDGVFHLQRSPSPDLEAGNVVCKTAVLTPGESISMAWRVKNIGNAKTGSGWTENFYLVSEETGEQVYIGNQYFNYYLAAGGYIDRNNIITLPQVLGMEGEVRLKVDVVPNSSTGEYQTDRANNTATSEETSTLGKKMFLTVPAKSVREGGSMRLTLKRSGYRTFDETFAVTSSTPQAVVPAGVTINAGQSAASFLVQIPNNAEVNENSNVTINVAAANGYAQTQGDFMIEDDDLLPLTVSLDKEEYNEGETMHLTVSVPRRIGDDDLTLSFSIEQLKRFRLPQSYTFPKGQTTAVIDIPIINDNTPANQTTIQLNVSASHHQPAKALFILNDDDVPAIAMTLQPTTVSEGQGANAIFGTITRQTATNSKITLKLSDTGSNALYYTSTITMNEGVTDVTFPIGVKDNTRVDGDREIEFKAEVYITDCGCSAIGDRQTVVRDTITILDNDGPALSISSAKTTILEGNAEGTMLTISRNDDTTGALTVQLECSASDMTYPPTVTIPAGSESVTARLTANSNATNEGNRTVTVMAKAAGYSSGTAWLMVSDQTLPDVCFGAPTQMPTGELLASDSLKVSLPVTNIGASAVPAGCTVDVTLNDTKVRTATIPEALAVGGSYNLNLNLNPITVPGEYTLKLTLNSGVKFKELQSLNNTCSSTFTVKTIHEYEVSSNKDKYLIGDEVTLSGKVTSGGKPVAETAIEPYVVFSGMRTALSATTGADGTFTCTYTIPAGMGGEFVYGVCVPGEGLKREYGRFDVYGLERASKEYIKHEVYVGEPYLGTVVLKNLSALALHNIQATVEDATGNYKFVVPAIPLLEGNGTADLSYALTSLGVSTTSSWDIVTMHLVSDEGVTLDFKTYNYTRTHTPKLVADPTNITTTVNKDNPRNINVTLTNTGMGETGAVTVSMPEGLKDLVSLMTPSKMPSMKTGDSATVVLRFRGDKMPLNLVQKGNLAINCEKGGGVLVYFNIKVVSEQKGGIKVRVRDENTIYGNAAGEHPYVSGATVRLSDYNTGAIVASGLTDEDGYALFEDIDEGYYQLYVTADKHDSYRQNVLISPGEVTEHLATISYQAVSVGWTVEETTVEDEYNITTSVTYETQVPVPVVQMTCPKSLNVDSIAPGESMMFNIVLRNKGLIAAEEVNIELPTIKGFTLRGLVEYTGFTLPSESSYIIPVLMTRNLEGSGDAGVRGQQPRKASGGAQCSAYTKGNFKWPCGSDSKYGWMEDVINLTAEECKESPRQGVTWERSEMLGNPGLGFGGGGGGGIAGGDTSFMLDIFKDVLCAALECLPLPGGLPGIPECLGASSHVLPQGLATTASSASELMKKVNPLVSCIEAVANAFERAPERNKADANNQSTDEMPDMLRSYWQKAGLVYIYLQSDVKAFAEQFGMEYENFSIDDELADSLENINAYLMARHDDGTLYDLNPYEDIPVSVSTASVRGQQKDAPSKEQMGRTLVMMMPDQTCMNNDFELRHYVEHVINDFRIEDGMTPLNDNHTRQELMRECIERMDSCEAEVVKRGFANWDELIQSANKDALEFYENQSQNTCAQVKFEINQKLVLTRQAFRGTLTLDNALKTDLKDISLTVTATDMLGHVATSHEMQINFESIEGFEGEVGGPWTLKGGKTGKATVLFIPTKYAAPDTLTTYAFGGTLYFNDGNDLQARDLYPVKLQVKPSPELDLTYFMQRDVYGDNPLTDDVVEPVIPAEFTVLIHNKGNGQADNVRMFTKQPKIVDNEKGLLVDFAIVGSSLNGKDHAMALDSTIVTQFGDIPAGSSSYATWDLTASLLGHFTSYDVSYSHVTSYGNPDLSLLDRVTIHELIHSVNAYVGDKLYRGWVTNDYEDGHSEPDHIYLSNGTDEDLTTLHDVAEMTRIDSAHYSLTVTAPQKGWYYTKVTNPGGAHNKILGIRNVTANTELDPANFWTTDYTMQDGMDPVLEYKLHIANMADAPGSVTYIVEFEPMPAVELDVVSIKTVPNEEDIAEEVIDELTVTFNKEIDHTTFTRDDIVLRYEGQTQTIDLPITRIDNKTFKLDTHELDVDGFYVLQVKTDSIRDLEGFWGYNGKLVRWMLFQGGLVHFNVDPYPSATYGSITSGGSTPTGAGQYGETVELTAEAAEGYQFSHWAEVAVPTVLTSGASHARRRAPSLSGVKESELTRFSEQKTITIELNKVHNLVAVFEPKTYTVTVECAAAEGECNVATGIYKYGTELTLTPTAKEGYAFDGYVVNGVKVSGTEPYALTVEGNTKVELLFHSTLPPSLLFNDAVDYVPKEIAMANATLFRSFAKGVWNTICLPCAVADPVAVFGSGTEVAQMVGRKGNMIIFSLVTEMEANVPYIIKPGTVNTSIYAEGAHPTLLYTLGLTPVYEPEAELPAIEKASLSFIGAYAEQSIEQDNGYYYLKDDQFVYVDEEQTASTGRFRGYFHDADASYVGGEKLLTFDDILTTVILPEGVTQMPTIYRLDGSRVSGSALDTLPEGIYVIDGKKVSVRR